jgi:pimeloyl-ACP methyl ester carboxylesterase
VSIFEGVSNFIFCKGRELHYIEWGATTSPVVILWHGLARNARDFDVLAIHLASRYRVIVPDTIGRGLSQWSVDPATEYCFDFYALLVNELVNSLGIQRLSWLGTSFGGSLGIRVAGGVLKDRLDCLILNDMGPEPNPIAMLRIKNYIGLPPSFDTVSQFEAYCREIYEPFGWHSDSQWLHMATTSMRRLPSGKITTHYDPAIVRQLFDYPNDFTQWDFWDNIDAPIFLLRGEVSEIVLPELVTSMKTRQPRLKVVEVPNCGHAPGLNVLAQLELITQFLAHGTHA